MTDSVLSQEVHARPMGQRDGPFPKGRKASSASGPSQGCLVAVGSEPSAMVQASGGPSLVRAAGPVSPGGTATLNLVSYHFLCLCGIVLVSWFPVSLTFSAVSGLKPYSLPSQPASPLTKRPDQTTRG